MNTNAKLCIGGPVFNENFQSLNGTLFEELFVIERQDRYDFVCGLHDYDKHKYNSTGATESHCGHPLLEDSSVNPLVSICVYIILLTLGLTH